MSRIVALTFTFAIVVFFQSLYAQSIDSLAPSAPTSFSSDIDFSQTSESSSIAHEAPGLHLLEFGKNGKVETISIRGSQAKDVAVSLEGIRLNSVNGGEFDFGSLSPFGLGETKVIRGGYSPTSSSPSGQVLLKLPRENIYKAFASYGSYQSFSLGQQTPWTSFSLDQSEDDYPYEIAGIEKTREHNASQRVNFRAWTRGETYQVWTQLLYTDLDLPGPTNFLTPHASSQTISPILAYQGRWKNQEWALWGLFQNQSFKDTDSQINSLNRSWSSGFRNQARYELHPKVQLELLFEWTQDKLYSDTFTSPLRQTFSLAAVTYIDLTDRWLLQPRVRGEFVSDLNKERFSAHPGIGTRYRFTENIDLLANFAYISRSPNFQEMYFKIEGYDLDNPNLKRQQSTQGDAGYEFHDKIFDTVSVKFQQVAFIDRTENILQSVKFQQNSREVYQVQNLGTAYTTGLEGSGSLLFERYAKLEANYSLQRAELSENIRTYQPTHRLNFVPTWLAETWGDFSLPLYFRSSVKTNGGAIGKQWDLGFKWRAQIKKLELGLQLMNLLSWNREEVENYPLSSEASGRISASLRF